MDVYLIYEIFPWSYDTPDNLLYIATSKEEVERIIAQLKFTDPSGNYEIDHCYTGTFKYLADVDQM